MFLLAKKQASAKAGAFFVAIAEADTVFIGIKQYLFYIRRRSRTSYTNIFVPKFGAFFDKGLH